MNIIFTIQGGLGKSIVATAVCKAIKKKYTDCNLIVVTAYPEVFTNLHFIDRVFAFGEEAYFYSKYIENQEVLLFNNDPYVYTQHILSKEHLIKTWCNIYGLDYDNETPEISINARELTFYANKYGTEKPILVIQTNGGAAQQETKYSWARDIPNYITQKVIDEFSKEYHIYHIRREDQFSFENTTTLTDGFKGVASVIYMSKKRFLMDSFAQHTASALGLKSTVLWIANKPEVFGYRLHDNIIANPETIKPDLRNSFLTKYQITGALNEYPYRDESEMFDIDRIIESIVTQ
tara:strand:- start:180 stop:1055 length:876 start_codon:yes stop_codon:yes gene_type:complete